MVDAINSAGFLKGKFVKELKNRFLCEVLIDDVPTECYVPSSCHLSNFLTLRGKSVLLLPAQDRNSRTKYALYAVPYKRNYIVLNTSMANKAIEQGIHSRRFSFLGQRSEIIKEHNVDGYKADLYIKDTDTIVECICRVHKRCFTLRGSTYNCEHTSITASAKIEYIFIGTREIGSGIKYNSR